MGTQDPTCNLVWPGWDVWTLHMAGVGWDAWQARCPSRRMDRKRAGRAKGR